MCHESVDVLIYIRGEANTKMLWIRVHEWSVLVLVHNPPLMTNRAHRKLLRVIPEANLMRLPRESIVCAMSEPLLRVLGMLDIVKICHACQWLSATCKYDANDRET